jgi:hypothetical protein
LSFSELRAAGVLLSSEDQVEELANLASRTKNHRMSFRRLIDELVKVATTSHLDPAPIAVYPMHPSDVTQSLFRHGKISPPQ